MKQFIFCLFPYFLFLHVAKAQDSLLLQLPDKYLSTVNHTSQHYAEQLEQRSTKALNRLSAQEQKMRKKLWKKDSLSAKRIFPTDIDPIGNLRAGITSKVSSKLPPDIRVDGYLDTLRTTLHFLDESKLDKIKGASSQLTGAMASVQNLQSKLQQTEKIKGYIQAREQQLKEQLSQYSGIKKNLEHVQKERYYYTEQLKEYKTSYQDPKKAAVKAMALLKKSPLYNQYIAKHSQLAGLFKEVVNDDDLTNIEGYQTWSKVQQEIQKGRPTESSAQDVANKVYAQGVSKLDEMKSKFPNLNSTAEMPDFKPRELKSKTFFQRLSPGGNIQFQRSNKFFPSGVDVAAQLGYRFAKNGNVGIGLSYGMGVVKDSGHTSLSHQGLGFRSYFDYKLSGSYFMNAGFEFNRTATFKNLGDLEQWYGWKRLALVGISKKYKISAKVNGNVMILYDFLASSQLPKTSHFKFRIGYSL